MKIIFIKLNIELLKVLLNMVLIVLHANVKEIKNGRKKIVLLVIKKEDNVNIYLRKMDTLENYGKAVKNLLMVVCLNLTKSFLNVGYNKNTKRTRLSTTTHRF